MAHLTRNRTMDQVSLGSVESIQVPLYRAVRIYEGAMVALRTADGYAVRAGTATTGPVMGISESHANNTSGSDGDLSANLLQGSFWRPVHATHPPRRQDVGLVCYASDDQTVSRDSGHGPAAGIILKVDSQLGCLVAIFAQVNLALGQSAGALQALLASVLNTEGASMIGVEDAAFIYAAADVEACLAEVKTIADDAAVAATLASVLNTEGASMIGVEDFAGVYAAADVEACLEEVKLIADDAAVAATLASVLNTEGASMIGVEDAAFIYAAADVEACLAEVKVLADHLATKWMERNTRCLSLDELRIVDGAGDVGNIVANGGVTASDTVPILRGDAAESRELYWAIGQVAIVSTQFALDPYFDPTEDVTVDIWVYTDNTNADPANFTLETSWNGGALVVDAFVDAAPAAAAHMLTATIAAADIPAGAGYVTLILTPPAHATDGLAILAARVNYHRA